MIKLLNNYFIKYLYLMFVHVVHKDDYDTLT